MWDIFRTEGLAMTDDIKNYGCVLCEESRFTWCEDSDIPMWYCKQTGKELQREDGKLVPGEECEEGKK